MELIKLLKERQERESKHTIVLKNTSDVKLFFDGQEIGRLQTITIPKADYARAENVFAGATVVREGTFLARSYTPDSLVSNSGLWVSGHENN